MRQSTSVSARISTYLPPPEIPSSKERPPSAVTGHVHEEVDVGRHIPLGERDLRPRRRQQEALAAAVHGSGVLAVANGVTLGRACAADRIVPTAGVGDDREERTPRRREELAPRLEVELPLRPDRVRRAVAVACVVGVVEERIDGLVALEIHDAEKSSPCECAPASPRPRGRPRSPPRAEDPECFRRAYREESFNGLPLQAKKRSVFSKPRAFSGRERRQGSSGPGGADWKTVSFTGRERVLRVGIQRMLACRRAATRTFISALKIDVSTLFARAIFRSEACRRRRPPPC